jgi:iron complex outermembrane receptor protein
VRSCVVIPGLLALSLAAAAGHARADAVTSQDLANLSIEELGRIQVTSVSKRTEPLSQAPSAIYVITHDDIARSGATTLPEILRLAPNLQVAQTSGSGYVITARGFNGNPAAQSFSNKLLVLIDGRSVYSPLFSGVYWDMQDVLPQDVERIEVISGPGATLWGANAVNGVINIITRPSDQTQGGLIDLGGGDRQRLFGVRYGGRLNQDVTYRLYARGLQGDDFPTAAGADGHDRWSRVQGGLRLDWTPRAADRITLQADAYGGSHAQAGAGDEDIAGRNVLARWTHSSTSGSELQVEAYYDFAQRETVGGGELSVDTYDFDIQHHFAVGDRQQIVWGGGLRTSRYRIDGTPTFFFVPASGNLDLGDAFAQDTIALARTLQLTVGVKIEDDPYVSAEALPNVRLAWSPSRAATLWAAVSKAVRSPTPFDRDVAEKLAPTAAAPQLIGDAEFQHEKLTAYEAGVRLQPSGVASLSISGFYNDYDQLRTIELSAGGRLPLLWGNLMRGSTYGVEAWGEYRVSTWWRLSGGVTTLHEDLRFEPGATGILGVGQAGQDPRYQATFKSSMNLARRLTLDADLRWVGALKGAGVPAYVELNSRLGWNLTDRLELSVSGRNLLHERHVEYPGANAIPRSIIAELQWRF